MKLQKINTLTLFIFLIITTSVSGMEQSNPLCKAVREGDESTIAMLLNNKADPYQLRETGKPICFYATTITIAKLFVGKINKDKLLKKPVSIDFLLGKQYPSEIMEFWFAYGVNSRYLDEGYSLFHHLTRSIYSNGNTKENMLAKGELLLKYIPDMINTINGNGETPLDEVISDELYYKDERFFDMRRALIEFFREHGAKTSKQLEEENNNL